MSASAAGARSMQAVTFPLAFGHWQLRKDRLTCRLPRKTVDVRAPGPVLRAVLEHCSGQLAWKEVAARLAARWPAAAVEGFMADLCRQGVLVEAGESLARWQALGELPASLPRLAAPQESRQLAALAQARLLPGTGLGLPPAGARAQALAALLAARQTHRTFADRPLPCEDLAAILWAAHGVARAGESIDVAWHRTTGSGGNLHAGRWFVAVLRELPCARAPARGTAAGLYEARFHQEGGASLEPLRAGARAAWACLLDPRPLRFASALLLPVWDLAALTRKYGNRATVFATLEAGQSLQNAQLMAAALDAGCGVRGDTCAEAVLDLLDLRRGQPAARAARWLALPGLVVGSRPSPEEAERQRSSSWIKVGPITPATRGPAAARGFAFHAGPVPVGAARVYTSGRSADAARALAKAEAEAWERLGWARMTAAEEGRQREVEGALDPRETVAYTPAQYRRPQFPCTPFSPRRRYLWVAGADVQTGAAVKLPAECVHAAAGLPPGWRDRLCTASTTSGVAAWTDADGALERALLELVERDAFLRCWISTQAPGRVAASGLPAEARRRLQSLEHAGMTATVCQVGSEFAQVLCIHLRSRGRPFAAITAAADFALEAALDRALSEAEGRAGLALQAPAAPLRSPQHVLRPEDIHRLYQSPRHVARADFFAAGPRRSLLAPMAGAAANSAQLRQRLAQAGHRLLAFDITPAGASLDQGRTPLRVVRAFATGLLPIWFHHALAPAGLPAFRRALARRTDGHGSRRTFLHPFT